MGVETREIAGCSKVFRTRHESSESLAVLLEAAAAWLREHPDKCINDITLWEIDMDNDNTDLELHCYYE